MRFEGARSATIGAFHKRNATVQKTLEFDGNHPGKQAFERIGHLHLISYGVSGCCPLHSCVTGHALTRIGEDLGCGCVWSLGRSSARSSSVNRVIRLFPSRGLSCGVVARDVPAVSLEARACGKYTREKEKRQVFPHIFSFVSDILAHGPIW